jgi:hypothetical protein
VRQAAEYREHAAECRKLAMTARSEPERVQLSQMAEAWERMALERERPLASETPEPTIDPCGAPQTVEPIEEAAALRVDAALSNNVF